MNYSLFVPIIQNVVVLGECKMTYPMKETNMKRKACSRDGDEYHNRRELLISQRSSDKGDATFGCSEDAFHLICMSSADIGIIHKKDCGPNSDFFWGFID